MSDDGARVSASRIGPTMNKGSVELQGMNRFLADFRNAAEAVSVLIHGHGVRAYYYDSAYTAYFVPETLNKLYKMNTVADPFSFTVHEVPFKELPARLVQQWFIAEYAVDKEGKGD